MDTENTLIKNKHVLVCIEQQLSIMESKYSVDHIKKHFCGKVITDLKDVNIEDQSTLIYMTGNVKENLSKLVINNMLYIIKELSNNYEGLNYPIIQIGEVPINVHNVGIYFRNFFNDNNYFNLISQQHEFQTLTESNKPSSAFRTGIYLSKVTKPMNQDELHFNLLRCSTNLNGPTDNFKDVDNEIINKINDIQHHYYEQYTELNHVLAQIYKNPTSDGSDKKAKISEHSDKTKDMPRNGLMAFCTFYENYEHGTFTDAIKKKFSKSTFDEYDYCYKNISVLTKMRFRLKNDIMSDNFIKQFDITLYPNSVFIMSLEMNRIYTHEIMPSILSIQQIPTRMGYVVRCSKTKAIYKNNQTYIKYDDEEVELEQPDVEGIKKLKQLYLQENVTSDIIHYGKFNFSLNNGDYLRPNI